ncbi:UNVERIFIED_CONTAM: hypothetical protein ACS92_07125 [Bacillus cereus]
MCIRDRLYAAGGVPGGAAPGGFPGAGGAPSTEETQGPTDAVVAYIQSKLLCSVLCDREWKSEQY